MAHRDALWAVLGYSIFLTVPTFLGYPFQVLCRIVKQLTHFSEICILGFFFLQGNFKQPVIRIMSQRNAHRHGPAELSRVTSLSFPLF